VARCAGADFRERFPPGCRFAYLVTCARDRQTELFDEAISRSIATITANTFFSAVCADDVNPMFMSNVICVDGPQCGLEVFSQVSAIRHRQEVQFYYTTHTCTTSLVTVCYSPYCALSCMRDPFVFEFSCLMYLFEC
ncbi:hypothetical protein Tcan_01346, partial [Toxocara canis]